jgi:hypothetical protein
MPESLSNWLALREPADTAARAGASHALAALTAVLARTWGQAPLRVLDLAAGTGANFRYLAPRLATPQEWLLVDHDARLLAEVPLRLSAWGERTGYAVTAEPGRTRVEGSSLACTVETRSLDLGAPGSLGICAGRQLVTASALLDLVSEHWLHALAEGCRAAGAAVFFALTYNGMSRCSPAEPEDGAVLALFNQHQARDKGLGGPAAGPGAVDAACVQGRRVPRATRGQRLGARAGPAGPAARAHRRLGDRRGRNGTGAGADDWTLVGPSNRARRGWVLARARAPRGIRRLVVVR